MKRRPPRSRSPQRPEKPSEPVRLQAYLARAGVASRRASEDLIREGRVRVNGKVAEIGSKVEAGDRVEVDGKPVRTQRLEWIALHKPKGYVTTRDDPEGRKTVYDLLPKSLHHLFHVGRLDRDSSGLILLTNDGPGANRLLHPRYGTTKEYFADVIGKPSAAQVRMLEEGIELEDGIAQALSAGIRGEISEDVYRIELVMQEGRRREVRRMLDEIGFPVRRLFRRRFGPIDIGRLAPGKWRKLEPEEVRALRQTERPDRNT